MPQRATVEAMIKDVVYDAALARARNQAQSLRAVAREILFEAAAQVEPVGEPGRPAARVITGRPRRRLRFPVPPDEYDAARDRLHAAGVSVTAALEEGLERFARTGEFREITH